MNFKPAAESVLIIPIYIKDEEIFLPLVRSITVTNPKWKLPGGGVNDEFPIIAAHRELKEETGLHIVKTRHVFTLEKPSRSKKYTTHRQYIYIGEVPSVKEILTTVPDGGEELVIELFSLYEILNATRKISTLNTYEFLDAHAKILETALQKIFS